MQITVTVIIYIFVLSIFYVEGVALAKFLPTTERHAVHIRSGQMNDDSSSSSDSIFTKVIISKCFVLKKNNNPILNFIISF